MLRRKTAIGLHLVFWLLFIGMRFIRIGYAPVIRLQFSGLNFFSSSYLMITALVFYINYFFLLPVFGKKKPVIKYLLPVVISYLLFLCIRYGFEEVISPAVWGYRNYYGDPPVWFYAYDNLYFAFPAVVFSTIIWILVHNVRLMEENAQMNVQRASAELKFLRAQVNPHFIFNTLNNIYSLVDKGSKEALTAIEALANIMRFTTYDAEKEYVPLIQELYYVENLIALEQLRHETPVSVRFTKQIDNEQRLIPPFILMPFVENALKHGITGEEQVPVLIDLKTDARQLVLTVTNGVHHRKKDTTGGIGRENIKKRLDFYYPAQYELEYEATDRQYRAYLKINLSKQ